MKVLTVTNDDFTLDRFEDFTFYRDGSPTKRNTSIVSFRCDCNLKGIPLVSFHTDNSSWLKDLKIGTNIDAFIKSLIKPLSVEASLLFSKIFTIQKKENISFLSLTSGCQVEFNDFIVTLDIYTYSGYTPLKKQQQISYDVFVDYRYKQPENSSFRSTNDISYLLQYHSGLKRMELVTNNFSNNGLFGFNDNIYYAINHDGVKRIFPNGDIYS